MLEILKVIQITTQVFFTPCPSVSKMTIKSKTKVCSRKPTQQFYQLLLLETPSMLWCVAISSIIYL